MTVGDGEALAAGGGPVDAAAVDGLVDAAAVAGAAEPWHTVQRHGSRRANPEPWPTAAQRAAVRAARSDPGSAPRRVPDDAEYGTAEEALELPVAPVRARPRVDDDPGLLGLTRRSHSRLGSRLFTLFFILVFTLIIVQMMVVLLAG